MNLSETAWGVFKRTGYFGAYLLYKDYQKLEVEERLTYSMDMGDKGYL